MFIGYSIEFYSRREFLHSHLLEKEKKKVDKANLELEDRVRERTSILQQTNEKLEIEVLERKLAENTLKSKVEFERLITNLSQKFIRIDLKNIDKGINRILKNIAEYIDTDYCLIKIFRMDYKSIKATYSWSRKRKKRYIKNNKDTSFENIPWIIEKIKKHKTVNIRKLSELPLEAQTDLKTFSANGIQSLIYTPLIYTKSVVGFLGFESSRNSKICSEQFNLLLKIVADMIVNALERKKSYDLLIKSEQKYRTLFEESQDAVFISTPAGELLEINSAGVELFGYTSKEELLKVNIAKDLYLSSEEREKYMIELNQNGLVRNYESIFKKKNGDKIIINETTTLVTDEKSNSLYHGILRNVTEQAGLQQQLMQSQKMESIGMLAGGIAHDFNNILTAINGYAEILSLKMKENDPLKKDVQGIINGGQRAINLTRQLLAFSRKQHIKPKVIDIDLIITELDKMLRRLIGEDIDLVTTLLPNTKRIKADPSQIEQILINLTVNARDAINQRTSRAAEKKITIETGEEYLDKDYIKSHPGFKEGDYSVVSISDTGIGIKDEIKEKIFEPFYTTKKVGEGTGLGLSTVYGIVKQNNGFIYVYSEPDKGTTFKIYWPQADQEIQSDLLSDSDLTRKIKSGHETILFVEDDLEVRKYATKALNSIGYNIIEAENGKKALEILGKDNLNIKLLVTDIVMPEMGGKELAEIIKKIQPSMKILFTSGYTDNHLVHNGTLEDEINYLQKPYSLQSISYEIRNILDN